MNLFIGGIPASGKTYLANKVANETGAFHVNLDTLRKEMRNDPKLKFWTDFFFNIDEEEYLKETSCDKHWDNLVKQSEAFWPTILNKVKEVMSNHESAIFEGVNILPHLAKKDFNFPGIFLLGESFEQIFERNKKNPRWGHTEELQRKEAELFFNCDRKKYKEEAEKYGYKTFENSEDAEKELIKLLGSTNYIGVIIEESLADISVLKEVKTLDTKVEEVTSEHQTPWLKQWTLHTVEVPEDQSETIAGKISKSLDYSHNSSWYADFKNNLYHFIIFKDRIFKIKLNDKAGYQEAKQYGISLGIPEYQVDFTNI